MQIDKIRSMLMVLLICIYFIETISQIVIDVLINIFPPILKI
jgi:hypothetical protein